MSGAASLTALRDRIRRLEQPVRHGVLPFGCDSIDRALPGGGLALGAMHEILGAGGDEEDGAAAAGFAAGILARLGPRSSGNSPILWCLRRPDVYGPGLLAHGLDPARLVLVAARRDDDILWAVEEGLRAPGLAAIVGEIAQLPMVAGRRLQLAAERSGVTLLLLRRWRNTAEAAERTRPSAAQTRWRITALPSITPFVTLPRKRGREGWGASSERAAQVLGVERWQNPLPDPPPLAVEGMQGRWRLGLGKPRWRVELLRCRGGMPAAWDVEVADATGHVSLPAGLADRPAAPIEQRPRRVGIEPLRRAG